MLEVRERIKKHERTLITTLTKKSAEDLSEYLSENGLKVAYLHSEIETIERVEILKKLRMGIYDILVGINLLREGIDLPEVSLVIILDADKMGFLRSARSLIQIIGRSARHINGRVIMYADVITDSISQAIRETDRRRKIQEEYNRKNNITPRTIEKVITNILERKLEEEIEKVDKIAEYRKKYVEKSVLLREFEKLMYQYSENLEFEKAAEIRDEIAKLEGRKKHTAVEVNNDPVD
jgi:excinuclease ABC subunit B